MTIQKKLPYIFSIFLIIVLDQLTKHLVLENLAYNQTVTITPFFNLIYVHNFGAAFSFLGDASGWQRFLFITLGTVLPIILFIWLCRTKRHERLLPVALSLVIGGAIGNVIDRIRLGYVIDFIQLHIQQLSWPVFNVADMAITFGIVMLIWHFMKN